MGVSLNSRYANGHYASDYPDPRRYPELRASGYTGQIVGAIPVISRTFPTSVLVDATYTWVAGDRWDTVAAKLGFPKTEWWRLLDANRHIEFPTAMRPGDLVNVPVSSSMRLL